MKNKQPFLSMGAEDELRCLTAQEKKLLSHSQGSRQNKCWQSMYKHFFRFDFLFFFSHHNTVVIIWLG